MPWDGVNQPIFDDPDVSTYQPWKGSSKGWETCTADMCILLDEAKKKGVTINNKFIAKALAREQRLHKIHTLQISSNNRFASAEFKIKKDMESFCMDRLYFDDFDTAIVFKPGYKQRPEAKKHLHVSFLNVPAEADQDEITQFVEQHFTVVENPHYPKDDYDGITFYTGARIYKCQKKIIEHLPYRIRIFGRSVIVIYDGQPDGQQNNNNKNDNNDTEPEENNNIDNEDCNDAEQHNEQETNQQATNPTKNTNVDQSIISTPIEADTPQISDQTQNQRSQPEIETNTTTNQQTTIVPPTPMPILQQRETEPEIQMSSAAVSNFYNSNTTTILEEGEITDTNSQMSPTVRPKQRYTTRNTPTHNEINEAARLCVQLHKNSFCDIGRLDKFVPSK